jgi:hypothetical protein
VLEPREVTAGLWQAAASSDMVFRTMSAPGGAAVPEERHPDAANDCLVVNSELTTESRWQGALLSNDADMVGKA